MTSKEQCYDVLTAGEIKSGALLFTFNRPRLVSQQGTLNIWHDEGCNMEAEYFISNSYGYYTIHIIEINSSKVSFVAKSDDHKPSQVILQQPNLFVAPFNVFMELLQKNLISITWYERCV